MITTPTNSESGHWYDKDGNPAYTIIGKNGKERNTTVADARKLDLVPSVTTILGIAAKPGLNVWLQQQVLYAALTLPRLDDESEEDWLVRVMSDAKSTGRNAADRGTRMHAVLECFYRSEEPSIWPVYVIETDQAVREYFGDHKWITETSAASEDGFGGKVDLWSDESNGIVIDFKTKEGTLDKVAAYHEHLMQLSAYRVLLGIPNARCANVFLNDRGDVKIIEHDQEDLADAYECFKCLLKFYRLKNHI
jgi:hypothetical protein